MQRCMQFCKTNTYNLPMPKSLVIFVFIFINIGLFAQQNTDTTYVDDYYTKDTNATSHFGLSIGSVVQGLLYSSKNSDCIGDSVSIIGSKPSYGFNIGIVFDKDITQKLWIHTGLLINISKLNANHSIKGADMEYSFSYSTLELPLWVQRAFKNKRQGLSWGAGITPSFDISKMSDKTLRHYTLKQYELLMGTGVSYRWHLPSGSYFNANLVFNIGMFNIFDTSVNSPYNNGVESGQRYQILFLISIN